MSAQPACPWTVEAAERELRADGFTLFPGFVDPATVQAIRERAAAERDTAAPLYLAGGPSWLSRHPELVLPIVGAPDVLDLAERLMGPFVQLDSFSVVGVPPGSPLDVEWHRDMYGSVPRGSEFQRPLVLNLLVYLQDTDDTVGPLRVLPGSHRQPLTMSDEERRRPHVDEVLVRPACGDAVFVHHNLVHSRSPNGSAEDRIHISVLLTLSCMRSTLDPTAPGMVELMGQLRACGDPRLLRLFGDDPDAVERYNCGFMAPDEVTWREWLDRERRAGVAP